jgi:hypothetical protein
MNGLYEFLARTSAVASLLGSDASQAPAIYFTLAAKTPPRPFLVIHLVSAVPAATVLDFSTPSLMDGRIQFDSYADDPLTARQISQAVRLALQDYNGGLPDGTVWSAKGVNVDLDDPYEEGGIGYIFRAVLDLSAFYTEPGT